MDNNVVSIISTIDNANVKKNVKRKAKTHGQWSTKNIPQPGAIEKYNKNMKAVDRSDQILGTNSVLIKCKKWWKILLFHHIDMSIVNSSILFRDHQRQFPEEGLRRTVK